MMAAQLAYSAPLFQVRELSGRHGEPAFEILFFDEEIGDMRCSENIWTSLPQAEAEAASMEARGYRPRHWGRIDG